MLMRHDIVSDLFSTIKNAESIGKKSCTVMASKLVKNILLAMQNHKYIGEFEFVDNAKGGIFRIQLLGRVNDCHVIKPRFSVGKQDFIAWEKRFLPSHSLGILIVSTPEGVISHSEAKKRTTGGKLLGYVY